MATPRGNRKKDAVVGLPPLPRSLKPSRSFAGEMESHSLAESPVAFSSSTRRAISFSGPDADIFKSRRLATERRNENHVVSTELGAIQETPSRPSSKLFFDPSESLSSINSRRVSLSSSRGVGLFRVPTLPEPRALTTNPDNQPLAPSTPVSSRHKNICTSTPDSSRPLSKAFEGARSSMVTETPPRQQDPFIMPGPISVPVSIGTPIMANHKTLTQSPPAIMGTPIKRAAIVPVTPDKSQTTSIYEQLGWDDDNIEL